MTDTYTLTFQPGNIRVPAVRADHSLLRAALEAGVFITSSCGGAGSCGKCRVQIISGKTKSSPAPKLSREDWDEGFRLACSTFAESDVEVFIPETSRMSDSSALDRAGTGRGVKLLSAASMDELVPGWTLDPVVSRICLSLKPPEGGDNVNDLARFRRGLKEDRGLANVSVDSIWIRNMPSVLRERDWQVTATVADTAYGYKVINLEPGMKAEEHYSFVLDIGTTTVWGQILDLNEGMVVATSSAYNKQIRYGEDVISRLIHAGTLEGREQLQQAIVDTINDVLQDLLDKTGVDRGKISHIMAAGNTTMTCLLMGIDPAYLRIPPYVPPADFIPPVRATNLGIERRIRVGRHVHIYTFPSVASYVGGDIVAGIVGSGVCRTEKITLYVDIGTNGEAVIGNKEWLIATSCSAGPAFEGGGVRHGMRATEGAIETVRIDPVTLEPYLLTIGNKPPLGICGSGIIDAVAELLRAGVLAPNGRFLTDLGLDRIRETEGAAEFVLVDAEYSGTGRDIVITEADIDNVIRAKAAVFAGIQTLLDSMALGWRDLEQIYVAGGFGEYLRVEQAQAIGLFPEIPEEKFKFVGNGSLLGARLVSFSKSMLKAARETALMMANVELSDNAVFMDRYTAAMFLPHTDLSLFPRMSRLLAAAGESRTTFSEA